MTISERVLDPSLSGNRASDTLWQRLGLDLHHTSIKGDRCPGTENGRSSSFERLTKALCKARFISMKLLLTLTLEDINAEMTLATRALFRDWLRRHRSYYLWSSILNPSNEPKEWPAAQEHPPNIESPGMYTDFTKHQNGC